MNLVLVIFASLVFTGSLIPPCSAAELEETLRISRAPGGIPLYVQELQSGIRLPVYRRPQNAAPSQRLDGLSRGELEGRPELRALLPQDHVGQTGSDQPTLYWFISQPTDSPVVFTLVDSRRVQPIIEDHLPPPHPAGIHSIHLDRYGVKLTPDVRYQWFVTLPYKDAATPSSRDIVAGGEIEYVGYIKKVMIYDPCVKGQNVFGLAECGLWYDALDEISNKIAETPHTRDLRLQRASLLEQEGLLDVAEFDASTQEDP